MRTPLLDLAETNLAPLQSAFLVASSAVQAVAHGADGRVSINMRPARLTAFLDLGTDRNARARARARAKTSGRTEDEELRSSEGRYYARRVVFEGELAGSTELSYGALNLGGLGAPYYGRYCGAARSTRPCGSSGTACRARGGTVIGFNGTISSRTPRRPRAATSCTSTPPSASTQAPSYAPGLAAPVAKHRRS